MARGNNRGRGGLRGSPRGDQLRGRGRGGGRGFVPGGRGRGRGRGGGTPDYLDDFDFPIVNGFENGTTPINSPDRGNWTPRGRGRGRPYSRPGAGTPISVRGSAPRRGRGGYRTLDDIENMGQSEGTPRGRGRGRGDASSYDRGGRGRAGRGYLDSRQKAGVPLSKLLREDRPLLRPIVFVRSVHTATLFEEEEEILQPAVEAAGDDEKSHVPTADRISEIFHHDEVAASSSEGEDEEREDEEQLEEIDFADIGKMQAKIDNLAASLPQPSQTDLTIVEEKFTGFYIDTKPTRVETATHIPKTETMITVDHVNDQQALGTQEDDEIIVYVAPHPRSGAQTPASRTTGLPSAAEPLSRTSILTGLAVPRTANIFEAVETETTAEPLSATAEESFVVKIPSPPVQEPALMEMSSVEVTASMEETAMEVTATESTLEEYAPLEVPSSSAPPAEDLPVPRFGESEPTASSSASATAPSVSGLTFTSIATPSRKQPRRMHPVGGPRSLLKRLNKTRRRSARGFGALGAMRDEEMLHDRDPREHERRYDSDVYWGTDDEVERGLEVEARDEVDEVSEGMGAMQLDEIDLEAMKGFVKSMSVRGQEFVTMDDMKDEDRMRREDDDEAGPMSTTGESGSDDSQEDDSEDEDEEIEKVILKEEALLIAEGQDADEEDDESEDEEATPRRGFQARLEKIRQNVKGKGKAKMQPRDEMDDDEDLDMEGLAWEDDDDILAGIEEILEENAHILHGRDRKKKKELFRSIQNGEFGDYFDDIEGIDDFEDMIQPAEKRKDKGRFLPVELREQWERDRQKKAENKAKRRQALLEAASDPLAQHKGGKKGRKAMLAAARYAGDDDDLPNRVVDFVSLEQQIRRFIADIGGRPTMVLPPCDKVTRKKVHEIADAFGLKSASKGREGARYTTLIKTSRTGMNINQKKIKRILNVSGSFNVTGKERKRPPASLAKHQEGEEVGKAAPKIGQSNIGFKMLAAMGWAEGDSIGMSGGLEAPLTAIMKKTKLGLGATVLSK